jgi:hypothetical protein
MFMYLYIYMYIFIRVYIYLYIVLFIYLFISPFGTWNLDSIGNATPWHGAEQHAGNICVFLPLRFSEYV